MGYAFVRGHAARFPVTKLCALLRVSTSGYYDATGRPASVTARCHRDLGVKVRAVHAAGAGRLGCTPDSSARARRVASTRWPRR